MKLAVGGTLGEAGWLADAYHIQGKEIRTKSTQAAYEPRFLCPLDIQIREAEQERNKDG